MLRTCWSHVHRNQMFAQSCRWGTGKWDDVASLKSQGFAVAHSNLWLPLSGSEVALSDDLECAEFQWKSLQPRGHWDSLFSPPSCYLPSPVQDADTRKESNNAFNFELNMLEHLKRSSICLLCPASKETETKLWGMAMVWEFPQLLCLCFLTAAAFEISRRCADLFPW